MDTIKIHEDLYWVGVRDPHLRVFDIIMRTDSGTTYNSYLIKGEKNILVETVKTVFSDEYQKKLEEIIGGEKIDYIIINHTEPDHSGAIKNILTANPGAQVICTKPAYMYLKAMLNGDFNCKTVADGEEMELGGRKFRFILAPFLHWPDTMFTYLIDEKVLISGDFLGCHYCPKVNHIFNDDTEDFSEEFKYYFEVIMGPFKEHVLKAVEKVRMLDVKMVCTSHGPVLRKDIPKYVDLYEQWSKDALIKRDRKYILIGYVSAYGYTRTIAEKLYVTLSEKSDFDVELIDISGYEPAELKYKIEHCDAVLVGSPTFNQDALKPVWDWLSEACPINVRNKLAAAFGSYGWSGEAVKMLEERLRSLKFKVIESGLRFNFAPSDEDLTATEKFALSLIEMMK